MGVHTGLAAPRGDDYVSSLSIRRRAWSAQHTGGRLWCRPAAAAVDGAVPFTLRSLGRYRLRDFDEPVELLQAAHDPNEEFGALRATPAEGHNLIRPATSFLGREPDQAGVASLLGPGRVVSVVGPGGVGKTRFVVETGIEQASQWRDGTWLVELASVASGELVASAVAATLGASTSAEGPRDALVSHLRNKRTLIVLDNCEHPSTPSRHSELVLRECPQVGMLATSREPLGLAGRWSGGWTRSVLRARRSSSIAPRSGCPLRSGWGRLGDRPADCPIGSTVSRSPSSWPRRESATASRRRF